MGAVIVAIASSLPLGASVGVLVATLSRREIRPCRLLRDHRSLARWSAGGVGLASTFSVTFASVQVSYQRPGLVVTCSAVAFLVGFVAWLLLVEGHDDNPAETPDEPEWWPAFERDLDAWSRNTRVPSGSAR